MEKKLPRNAIAIRAMFDRINLHPWRAFGCIFLLFLIVSACFVPYKVDIGHIGLVRRFGRYTGHIATPGLHFQFPWGIDEVTIVDAQKIHRFELTAKKSETQASGREFFTGDENIIDLRCVVQYQIEDVPNYLFHAEYPINIVFDQLEEMVITVCGAQNVDGILGRDKDALQEKILESLMDVIKPMNLGIKIVSINLDWIMPPPEAVASFMDVVDAKEDMYLAVKLAEKHKLEVVALANGLANRIVSLANAQAYTAIQQAKGSADRFTSVLAQNRLSPEETQLTEYYNMISRLVSQADVFVLRPNQGAQLEVNLLDKVLPPKLPVKKITKGKAAPQQVPFPQMEGVIVPPETYESRHDHTPGGRHADIGERPAHLELPSTIPPLPQSEVEVKNE